MNTTTSGLDEEANHVARHEDFREPLLADERVLFTVDKKDDAAKNDVDGCCEQRGSDQEEQRLHDERTKCPEVIRRQDSSDISNDFNYQDCQYGYGRGWTRHAHMPPTTRGMKYHVLLLHTWKACNSVVAANATTKMIAATFEGW